MKKSLVLFVVLLGSLALAGTVFAMDWGCYGHADLQDAALQRQSAVQRFSQRNGKTLWSLRACYQMGRQVDDNRKMPGWACAGQSSEKS